MLNELFNISSFPLLLQETRRPFGKNIATLFKIYVLIFLSIIITAWVIYLTDYFVTHVLHFKSVQNQYAFSLQHMLRKIGIVKTLVYICLIGPVLEETVFRLPLSFKKIHIALSIAVAIFLLSNSLPFIKNLNLSIGLGYALLIRIAFTALIYFTGIKLIPDNISFGPKVKKIVIIISMCLFGLLHISNFIPLQWALIWVYPFYVLPQLLMGWGLTYIRFKNGFIWGIALHCLINSVSMWLYTSPHQPVRTRQPYTYIRRQDNI
jgi:hypothetical protein